MARSVRVLFAGTTFAVGGAERVLSHLVRGLNRPPFSVELLALRQLGPIGRELAAEGIPVVHGLTGSGRVDPLLLPRLRRYFRSGRFDAIYFLDHAHAVFYGTVASMATTVRVRVMPVHTTGQWDGRPSLRRPIRLVRSHLDRIIAIAEAQRIYLMDREGVPARQLTVISNGIPLEQPGRSLREERRRAVREELGVAANVPVAGITAVLRPEKNHELLLRSFRRVTREMPQAELWIVGDGPRRGDLVAEAERCGLSWRAEDDRGAGLADRERRHADPGRGGGAGPAERTGVRVRFFGHRNDARRLMAGVDVAVLCSHPRVETLPLSLLESMDAALPVVSTRVGALGEMVEPGRSGHLVEPGDEEGLAAAILETLRDRETGVVMGERGQAIARERYSVERMVAATERLIMELLASRSRDSSQPRAASDPERGL